MKVYIVEDDEDMRFLLKRIVKKNISSAEVKGSSTAEQALDEIPQFNPDLALVDISLPGMDGIELIRRLKPQCDLICILVVTGHELDIYRDAAFKAGAHEIISKSDDAFLISSLKIFSEKRKKDGCH